MSSAPTIHDVAARAGVSKSTVSLVLRDSPLVKGATRLAVQGAMAELGYVYNAAAGGLRAGARAVPVPDRPAEVITLRLNLATEAEARLAANLPAALDARGFDLRLAEALPEAGLEAGLEAGRAITAQPSARAGVLGVMHPEAALRFEDGMAAAQATRHLLGLGAAQVAFIGGGQHDALAGLRLSGYLARMKKAEMLPLVLMGGDDFAFGYATAHKMAARFPVCNAALCFNDAVALGVRMALAERGTAAAFRLIGWGDTALAASAGLSSLAPDYAAMARACADWAASGALPNAPLPIKLIRRASSSMGA